MRRVYTISAACAALLLQAPASAAGLNVAVAARVISFLQPSPTGTVDVAIIFQPGNDISESEAADIERAIGGGMAAGRAKLRVRRVSVEALGKLAGARAAIVTRGLKDRQDEIAAAAASQAVVTLTADTSCVSAGRCVVGISAGDRTQITVSKSAARQCHAAFGSAFLMLVKEV